MNKFLFTLFAKIIFIYQCAGQGLVLKGGTSVIAVITNDSVLIAADSKHIAQYFDGGESENSICKIQHVKNIFYSFSGLLDISLYGKEIFNCYEIMKRVLSKGQNFNTSMSMFDSTIRSSFDNAAKQIDSLDFRSVLTKYRLFTFIVVSFINNKPVFKKGKYVITGDSPNNYQITYVNDELETLPLMYPFGKTDHMDSYISSHPNFKDNLENLREKLITLIKLEIDQHPREVGLPIDMIKITKSGFKWILRKQECL